MALLAVTGCSTMVTIQSEPAGADILINNQKIGTTPFAVKLSDFAFNSYDIILKKDGYVDYRGRLTKEVKVGTLIVGLFLVWVPILWCYGPQPYQTFYLSKTNEPAKASILNRADDVTILVNGMVLGDDPVELPAGTYNITFIRTSDGESLTATASLVEGNFYEFGI